MKSLVAAGGRMALREAHDERDQDRARAVRGAAGTVGGARLADLDQGGVVKSASERALEKLEAEGIEPPKTEALSDVVKAEMAAANA